MEGTATVFQSAQSGQWAADLSTYAKWRFTGPDRVRYLNGQVTNDVRTLRTGHSICAAVCNAKGRMEGLVQIHHSDDALYVTAEPALHDSLGQRLAKYLIADEVEITDLTDQWQLYFLPDDANSQNLNPLAATTTLRFSVNRYGLTGTDIWLPPGQNPPPCAPASVWDDLRIIHCLPAWGKEINAQTLPPEVRLETTAISYNKGCYIGQEVISRLKSIGHVNRLLCQLKGLTGPLPALPMDCLVDGQTVGTLTSATIHPLTGEVIALAMLQRRYTANGTAVLAGNHPYVVTHQAADRQ